MKKYLLILSILLIVGCNQQKNDTIQTKTPEVTEKKKRPIAVDNGKFFEKDGRKMLYGGENENQHFNRAEQCLTQQEFEQVASRRRAAREPGQGLPTSPMWGYATPKVISSRPPKASRSTASVWSIKRGCRNTPAMRSAI